MSERWQEFAAYADAASAEVVAGLLRSEGVPVNVASDEPMPGLIQGFAAQAGEYDGNEVAVDGSDGTLYMYGPDADKLFAAIRPALAACSFMKGALVRLRYGPPADGVTEREVRLAS